MNTEKPMTNSKFIRKMITNHPIKKIMEVGLWKGLTLKHVLGIEKGGRIVGVSEHHESIDAYWGVDPWMIMGDLYMRYSDLTQADWDKKYRKTCQLMMLFPKLHIIRAMSIEAVSIFPDNYFDMVFIDADHCYKAVTRDIGLWLPKVKPGGFFCGDDYESKHHFDVKPAVNDYFKQDYTTDERFWIHVKR